MNGSTNHWQIAAQAPPAYHDWCQAHRLLFAAPAWQPALTALGLASVYAWNEGLQLGALLPLRSQFGVRGGVLGFPVVNSEFQALPPLQIEQEARRIAVAAAIDLLRVNYSAPQTVPQATAWRPEVWLDDLAAALPLHKRLRKDLAQAHRSPLGLTVGPAGSGDAEALFALYLAVVRSHGGSANYTADYFRALASIAASDPRLRVHCARDRAGVLQGFAVSAVDGRTGFYLHAGASREGRQAGVSDLLLEQVLLHVRAAGCARLSLMSSPWDQPGLVRFKSKWGDTQRYAMTTDVAGSAAGALVRIYTRWRSRADRRQFLAPA